MTVANDIRIKPIPQDLLKWCKSDLVLTNPDFYKKKAMGMSTHDVPESIALYEIIDGELVLPFGKIQEVWKRLCNRYAFTLRFTPVQARKYKSSINLYPYQERAVSAALGRKNGVLVMPCGSGKTQCGLEIISRVGGRALWLTHTLELLNQSKDRALSTLEMPEEAVGTITEGLVNIGRNITFATVQTMSKIMLEKYRDCFDVVIVDECQHCCGSPLKVTQFYRVITMLNARFKIGLTATPYRADGLQEAMFALLGDKIHEVKKEEIDTTCPVRVKQIETGWNINDEQFYEVEREDGTIDYTKLVKCMVSDPDRLQFISDDIQNYRSVIVLANRIEYLKKLQKRYPGRSVCLSGIGNTVAAKQERKEALQKLNAGEIDALFATYQLAKEGLDVPSLRYVVFATPEKDPTTVIQSAGRVGRKAPGKDYGTVIDYVDDFPKYMKWARDRRACYEKIGAKVL